MSGPNSSRSNAEGRSGVSTDSDSDPGVTEIESEEQEVDYMDSDSDMECECANCAVVFEENPSSLHDNYGDYCNQSCYDQYELKVAARLAEEGSRKASCPIVDPVVSPKGSPAVSPTQSPKGSPAVSPTKSPKGSPAVSPTGSPKSSPAVSPTVSPKSCPAVSPTGSPKASPTVSPTGSPKASPTVSPIGSPTCSPKLTPSQQGKTRKEPDDDPELQKVHDKMLTLFKALPKKEHPNTRAYTFGLQKNTSVIVHGTHCKEYAMLKSFHHGWTVHAGQVVVYVHLQCQISQMICIGRFS